MKISSTIPLPDRSRSTFTGVLADILKCDNHQDLRLIHAALYDVLHARPDGEGHFDGNKARRAYTQLHQFVGRRLADLRQNPNGHKTLAKNYRSLFGRITRWIGPQNTQLDARVVRALRLVAEAISIRMEELRGEADGHHAWNRWVDKKRAERSADIRKRKAALDSVFAYNLLIRERIRHLAG